MVTPWAHGRLDPPVLCRVCHGNDLKARRPESLLENSSFDGLTRRCFGGRQPTTRHEVFSLGAYLVPRLRAASQCSGTSTVDLPERAGHTLSDSTL